MKKAIQKLINYEATQIGYKENADGWTKYGQWYADNVAKHQAFAKADWCVMYQSYCFRQVGIPNTAYPDTSPQGSSVRYNVAWMEKHGFRTKANDMPQPGDLVYYCWSGKDNSWDHIGLCVCVEGTTPDNAVLVVNEGNYGSTGNGKVALRRIPYRDPRVRATCRPNYPEDPKEPEFKMPELSFLLKQGSRSQAVEVLQAALIGNGYDIYGGADGYFGQYTKESLIKYQKAKKLIADGTAGTETFRSLLGLK